MAIKALAAAPVLQRKCACGKESPVGALCSDCRAKESRRLQKKLSIGASNDPLEREADRVADQVMGSSASPTVTRRPPQIQRYSRHAEGEGNTAPATVDAVLARPGRPMDPTLRADMEQRFGYDFSRVRVHSDNAAERSVRDVNAHAYTVGHNVVFGAGRYAPENAVGRRLIAHELTHVVQQSGADQIRLGESDFLSPDSLERRSGSISASRVAVHRGSSIRIAREPKAPSKDGIVLEIEIKPGWNLNDVRRKVTALDQLASRGRLIRAASPLPKRQTVPEGVAATEYGRINPQVSTEYKTKILIQGHKQIGPNSSNYDPVRWRKFFDLWKSTQGDHVQDLQLGGLDAEENMWLIDASTNEELGSYIAGKLRKVEPGTRIVAVRIKSTPPSPATPPTTIPPSATKPAEVTAAAASAAAVKPTGPNDSPTVTPVTPQAKAPVIGQLPPKGAGGGVTAGVGAKEAAAEVNVETIKVLRATRAARVLGLGLKLAQAVLTFISLKSIVDMALAKFGGNNFLFEKEIAQAQTLADQSSELEREYPAYSELIKSNSMSLYLAPQHPASLPTVALALFLVFSDVVDLRDNLAKQIPALQKALKEIKAKRAVAEAILNNPGAAGVVGAVMGGSVDLTQYFTAWEALGHLAVLENALSRFAAIEPQVKADVDYLQSWLDWLKIVGIKD